MARPIPLQFAPRDPVADLNSRLQQAPLEHAEAVLAGYEVLQVLHDRGVLELMRGALGGSDKILEQVVAVASGPEAIRASRNLLLLVKTLGEIEPMLLSDLTRAIPKALVQANAEENRHRVFSNSSALSEQRLPQRLSCVQRSLDGVWAKPHYKQSSITNL
jgi:hypothetical protein